MSSAVSDPRVRLGELIPKPVLVSATGGIYTLSDSANIYVSPASGELFEIGRQLATRLNSSTGFGVQVLPGSGTPASGDIYLTTDGADAALGDEGYELTITAERVTLAAYRPEGLFRGIQTLRQLLPAEVESDTVRPGPWQMATAGIRDVPRFAWRGAMLDVARHFFSIADVKRHIDQLAHYKINRLHLHLTDDQGWRLMINSWPRLATHGGSTQVGGGAGGYYTQAQYSEIVAYAQSRYMMVIPEIDMPGHTNAALASYAELNENGTAPALYTGIDVGFSSLSTNKDITYKFVDDVMRELAALTPGPYIHIGADEAKQTKPADFIAFVDRVRDIIESHGKQMIGWEEIGQATVPAGSIVQQWFSSIAQTAAQQGAKVIMSPASKAYLDAKYDASTELGLSWMGYAEVQDAYSWEPTEMGVPAEAVIGVEAPLWSETTQTMADVEFLVFPRLLGHAEIAWSPASGRSWEEYSVRLSAHGPRLAALGVNFFRTSQVPWK
jgi:hexosaminidase